MKRKIATPKKQTSSSTKTKKPRPEIGDLITVKWIDAAGYTNECLSKVVCPKASNTGVLVRRTKRFMVLQTGNYPNDSIDDPVGDFTAIPNSWANSIKIHKHHFNDQ